MNYVYNYETHDYEFVTDSGYSIDQGRHLGSWEYDHDDFDDEDNSWWDDDNSDL